MPARRSRYSTAPQGPVRTRCGEVTRGVGLNLAGHRPRGPIDHSCEGVGEHQPSGGIAAYQPGPGDRHPTRLLRGHGSAASGRRWCAAAPSGREPFFDRTSGKPTVHRGPVATGAALHAEDPCYFRQIVEIRRSFLPCTPRGYSPWSPEIPGRPKPRTEGACRDGKQQYLHGAGHDV